MKKADILILGAGCSGTSLAHYLEESGYGGKVVLLDSRASFEREQRWCGWSAFPESMSHLVQKSWSRWSVCDENRSASQTSKSFSYKQIYAPEFFSHFHSKWQNSSSIVELNLGERVSEIENLNDFVEVTTDKNVWQAGLVFDARNEGNKNLENAKKSARAFLTQTFIGWEVEFDHDVFDEENATLMDFRTEQIDGVNFIYVLPYTKRRALVESTSFSAKNVSGDSHSRAVAKYIEENYQGNYEIKAEEFGQLPMTTARFPVRVDERIFNIGIAGGSARASSGYAFHRIQRQTAGIANAIVKGEVIPTKFVHEKYTVFDDVLLNLINQNPIEAKDALLTLFEKVSPDTLIKFLADESSVADDLAIMLALPKLRFGILGFQSLMRSLITKDESSEPKKIIHNPMVEPSGRLADRQTIG